MAAKDFEREGFEEQRKQLERMMTTDPRMRENVQTAIRKVLLKVRKALSANAQTGLQMDSDPRHAYKAVRTAVYRRILGGQVNILARKKAGKETQFRKGRKGLPKRGGNRWGRSDRTIALEGYEGMDRGFILRFLNAGATDRKIHSFTSKLDNDRHNLRHAVKGGNRGSISPRNWFGSASQKELEGVSDELQKYIDDIIDGLVV